MEKSPRYTTLEKESIIIQYLNGRTVAELCSQYSLSRSTLYYWIRQFQGQPLKTTLEAGISYKNYLDLKRHVEKIEEKLAVIQAAGCGTGAPQKEKLCVMEKLYEEGQFSVRSLCEALEVSRGTFYNHIFRRKDVTAYDKRREEIRVYVKEVFDENQQRLGAQKIRAVLAERGVNTTKEYVADLMRNMGLKSISTDSKREYRKRMNSSKKQNLLQRQFKVEKPNTVWVSDITCFSLIGIKRSNLPAFRPFEKDFSIFQVAVIRLKI